MYKTQLPDVLGSPVSEGKREVKEKEYRIEADIEKIPSGWKITGAVQGKPGLLKLARFTSSQTVICSNWQSWGPAAVMDADAEWEGLESVRQEKSPWLFSPVPDLQEKHLISDYVLAWDKGLAGFLTSRIAHPLFIREGEAWTAALEYFDAEKEKPVPLEPLIILEGKKAEELLSGYADQVKEENKINIGNWNPVGWCSWYHYFRKIEWEDVRENLKEAEDFPFQVFQIDDGYQTEIGDWLVLRPGFPGLSEMAGLIRNSGFIPGIWTAPFISSENSRLFNSHPEWMVSEKGKPLFCCNGWGQKIYALDITQEPVQDWLFDVFSSLRHYGFEYFKLDFLFAGAMPGTRSRNITPAEAYRKGLRIIREAVEDNFILGCGAPLLPSAGIVDGMRVGEDTAPFWRPERSPFHGPNAYHALKNALMRHYMHRKFWLNDPDCLLLRHREIELTENERELYARTSGALDNIIMDSDRLSLIGPRGRRVFREAIQLRGGRVRVSGLMDGLFVIESKGREQGDFTLAVNIEDQDKSYSSLPVPARTAVFIQPRPEPSITH